jgi:hypothetical protein
MEKEYQEFSELEWLHAAATNPTFDFLKDPEEDIYTLADGRPFIHPPSHAKEPPM